MSRISQLAGVNANTTPTKYLAVSNTGETISGLLAENEWVYVSVRGADVYALAGAAGTAVTVTGASRDTFLDNGLSRYELYKGSATQIGFKTASGTNADVFVDAGPTVRGGS